MLVLQRVPTYLVKDQSMTMIRLRNGAKLQPLTASQKTVRGPHPPFLLLDEIDEMDPEILESAKGQPMPQKNYLGEVVPAQTVMASTLQYADKAMMQERKRFEEEGLLDEDGELDDFEDDLADEFDDEKLEDLAESEDDDEDDDEDEEGLDINKETEDWSESLDDMESDYWEDYTRGPR